MRNKKKDNFLDYIPKTNEKITWTENEEKMVVLKVRNNGFFAWIATKFYKKPEFSFITLDEFGTFVWKQIDDKQSVYEIGQKVKKEFGEKAEPLYERLIKYMAILADNKYISCRAKTK